MTPEHEVHHQHAHKTGHRLLDLAVPVSALLISVVSLVIGIHHGRTMQEMAQANARLVQANSWPLLQFTTGNANDKGEPEITLKVENAGVGPAKLVSLEIFQGEHVIRTPRDLIAALDDTHPRPNLSLGMTLPMVMRAGTDTLIVGMRREGNEALWAKLSMSVLARLSLACVMPGVSLGRVCVLSSVSPQSVGNCPVTPNSFTYLDTPTASTP